MSGRRQLLLILLTFAGLLVAWYASEIGYARRISPQDIVTIEDFFDQFGEPRAVRIVQSEGKSFYEFSGLQRAPLSFAIPSTPPAYIFDEEGRFVTWSKDPGDDPRHRRKWPLQGTNRVAIWTLKQKFWAPGSNFSYASISDRELFRLKQAAIRAAHSPDTWQRLRAERITGTPFTFNQVDVTYHIYFDRAGSLDLLIPSGGKFGEHSCFVRVPLAASPSG